MTIRSERTEYEPVHEYTTELLDRDSVFESQVVFLFLSTNGLEFSMQFPIRIVGVSRYEQCAHEDEQFAHHSPYCSHG